MQILTVLELNGPNIWTRSKAAEAWIELGAFANTPVLELSGWEERLASVLPGLSRGEVQELQQPALHVAALIERVTRELHTLAHLPVSQSSSQALADGRVRVVLCCESPAFAKLCFDKACELLGAVARRESYDTQAAVRQLGEQADRICLGPSTRAIVRAAAAQGIPSIRLSAGNLVQLGYCGQQRRIWTAETDGTGAIAESIAQDKELTRRLLSNVGIPVPVGRAVTSPEDCWAAAQELGLPVVVKPVDGNHGRGVSIRLDEQAAIEAAYGIAATEGSGVVVERFISGTQYRVLVVGKRAIAAAGSEADQVLGDGVSTVESLVASANQDPLRGEDSAQPLTTLVLDDISLELLRRQGLSRDSIPDQGRNVIIHYNGDLTADVTDRMHPEVASQCALAARAIGLDIAGIDLISESIALPLEQIGGAIIEVNASPALGVHLKPLIGTPRPVGEAIIEHMFGAGSETRVPLIAVSRPGGGAPLCRALAHLLRARGGNPVVADRAGLSVGTRFLTRQDSTHATGHTRALMNPFVDSAILETSLPGLLSQGLAFDQCSVAVVAGQLSALENVEVANFGPFAQFTWPLTQTDRTRAVGVLVESVQGAGIAVLNADDPQFSALTAHCTGTVAYFGTEASQRSLEIHAQRGAIVGIVEGGSLWLWRSRQKHKVRSLAGMVTSNSATFNEVVADLAAAVVAAVAVGIDLASLEAGLDAALIELGLH